MRVFISINLPENTKEKISSIIEELKKCEIHCKWVKNTNLHITLKFLGDINEDKLDPIAKTLQETADRFKPFETTISDFGFFPNQNKPRILYLSTTEHYALKNIAADLEKRMESLGFKQEGKFQSHITLARIKSAKNIDKIIEKIKDIKIREPLLIKELTLNKSILTPNGPIYEILFKKELS